MARAGIRLAMALSALWVTGCGSFYNCWSAGEPNPKNIGKPYGGVINSLRLARYGAEDVIAPQDDSRPVRSAILGLYFLTIDTPLSAVVDTATLPMFGLIAILKVAERGDTPKTNPAPETTRPEAFSKSPAPLPAPPADPHPRTPLNP